MSLVNQFIINLMSQHIVPFWITLTILFIAIVEVIYFKIIKNNRYRGSLGEYAVESKLAAIFITSMIFLVIWGSALFLEIISEILLVLLVGIGIATLIVGYFYVNYLFAKKYAVEEKGKHNFKKGDKLVVIEKGFNTGLKDGEIVTFVKDAPEIGVIKVQLDDGEIVSKKEYRFKKVKKKK